MLFAVLFTDKLWRGDLSAQHLQAHLEWLELNKDVIKVVGSIRQELGQMPKGGLWIAEASWKKQLDKRLKADPFYVAGLRQSSEILHWSKANEMRKALI